MTGKQKKIQNSFIQKRYRRILSRCNENSALDLIGTEAAARWPIEMQVLNEKITHIDYIPYMPETFAAIELGEVESFQPHGANTVVFTYPVLTGKKFAKSYNGTQIAYTSETKRKHSANPLIFESRFESGNLAKAVQVDQSNYELYLRPDLYSAGHSQWFYFRVQNMKSSMKYRFSIVNLPKIAGLYDFGMKPVMYSQKLAETLNIGWHRVGDEICYCKNLDSDSGKKTNYHTLSWTVHFPFENDTVYFAHSYPYTYTDLQTYLNEMQKDVRRSQWSSVETLCRSLAGNHVYLVTISSPIEGPHRKKVIVLTARVHPGETPSSWVMKGFMDFLTSDTAKAQLLRERFIFKLVPMLNPDGVIIGNNRYSLSGHDLNRTYRTLLKDSYPPTWHVRRMVCKLLEEYEVALYCDLHGHSRKPNMFIYGCENPPNTQNFLKEQIFPLILYQHAPDMFSFEQCKFQVHKRREGTGRVVMWIMGVLNSFTLEVSFAGSTMGCRRGTHFSSCDYLQIACHFCDALVEYFDESKAKIFENQLLWKKTILQQLMENGSSANEPVKPKRLLVSHDSESSAESCLSDDQIDESLASPTPDLDVTKNMNSVAGTGSDSFLVKKRKKRLRRRHSKQTEIPPPKAKPTKPAVWQPISSKPIFKTTTKTARLNERVVTRKSEPVMVATRNKTKTWREVEEQYEKRTQENFLPSYYLLRPGSPRRTRLRSLLNLQRSIIAQAIILRETSPLHKKLVKNILKETEMITEVLAKELQLVTENKKLSSIPSRFSYLQTSQQKLQTKSKESNKTVRKPASVPITTLSRLHPPPVRFPFKMSINSTAACSKYKGIMVP